MGRGRKPQTERDERRKPQTREAWAPKNGAWPFIIISMSIGALGHNPQTVVGQIMSIIVFGSSPQTVVGQIMSIRGIGRNPQTVARQI